MILAALSLARCFTGDFQKRSINSDSSFHVCFSQRSKLNRQRTFYRKRRGPRDHNHRGSAYGVSLATVICLLAFSSDIPLRCVHTGSHEADYLHLSPLSFRLSLSLSLTHTLSSSICTCTHAHVQTHKGIVRSW